MSCFLADVRVEIESSKTSNSASVFTCLLKSAQLYLYLHDCKVGTGTPNSSFISSIDFPCPKRSLASCLTSFGHGEDFLAMAAVDCSLSPSPIDLLPFQRKKNLY